MLCDKNMFKNTYEDVKDDYEHIEVDNKAKVDIEYKVHDPTIKWNKMEYFVEEMYESSTQLRFILIDYVIANGYKLWFMKYDRFK